MLGAGQLSAQSRNAILVGVGISAPTGDFHSYAGTGATEAIGFERSIGKHPVALRVDLSYAWNSDNNDFGAHESTSFVNAMFDVVYHFDGDRPRLYLLFGAGFERQQFTTDDEFASSEASSHAALQVGEGVTIPLGRIAAYAEGRFISSLGNEGLQRFMIVFGVRFGSLTR